MTWFLFASHGVPVITAIIQGRGLKPTEAGERAQMKDTFAYTVGFYYHIKTDVKFVQEKGDDLLGAFILPPLQIVSAVINFSPYWWQAITCSRSPSRASGTWRPPRNCSKPTTAKKLERKVRNPGRPPKPRR